MQEIELKFQIPREREAGVRHAMASPSSRTQRLQARYFDTPDRRLAAAGLALRLRQEDGHWVQTVKARGDGMMQRGEDEVRVPADHGPPALDLARHVGTPAAAALRAALQGGAEAALVEVFATDIQRTRREVRIAGGGLVEIALDEGEVRAADRAAPVLELEFELLRGPPSALAALAARWVARHHLWLDVRSKAERGARLARPLDPVPAVKATRPFVHPGMSGGQALCAVLGNCLEQALANACEVAAGSGTPEHLHQCRIGLRRLRCALRDFGSLAGDEVPAQSAAWQAQASGLFRRLGGTRDRDALQEQLLPALVAAGAPFQELPPLDSAAEEPGAVLRERAAGALWLAMLAYVHGEAAASASPDTPPELRRAVRATLHRLHRNVAREAAHYAELDEAGQHRVRKRLKRLRYAVEFCCTLFPAAAVARYLAAVRPAQDALGERQDLLVAQSLFEAHLPVDPGAWFAVGWLAARRAQTLVRCSEALADLAQAPRFWRGRGAG